MPMDINFSCHQQATLTIEHVLEAVVLRVLFDLISKTLAELAAHERVLLLALFEAESHLGQEFFQTMASVGIPHVELGCHEVGVVHALKQRTRSRSREENNQS